MTTQEPGRAPFDPDRPSAIPDEAWRLFLEECERAAGTGSARPEPATAPRTGALPAARPEAVGELWQPRERVPRRPGWYEMDARARRRSIGRALALAAAGVLILGALSRLPTGSGDEQTQQSETMLQEPTVTPAPPTATDSRPPRS